MIFFDAIIQTILGLILLNVDPNLVYGFNQKEKQTQLDILKNTEETSRLYDAVMNGLPVVDLSPDSNLGMNEEGYIVAYDC